MTDPAEPTLPAFKLRMFDPGEVFAQYVDGRRVVYLDNNIWIDLRDAENDEAVSCRDACKRVVADGRAIFPLSYGSVTEVLTNPSRDARERQADLMDALSLGVTFRSPVVVNILETETAYRVFYKREAAVGRRREVFTMIPEHLGTGWMHFPPALRRSQPRSTPQASRE